MKTTRLLLAFAALASALCPAEIVRARFVSPTGEGIANLPVRAVSQDEQKTSFITHTDEEGWFEFDLDEQREWFIEGDPVNLLHIGFFCIPGTLWPEDINDFIAVPLRPVITSTPLPNDQGTMVELDFDWATGLTPALLRRTLVERSTDMVTWEPVATVLLSDPPIKLIDAEDNESDAPVFYRTVEQAGVVNPDSPIAPIAFDPAIELTIIEGLNRRDIR